MRLAGSVYVNHQARIFSKRQMRGLIILFCLLTMSFIMLCATLFRTKQKIDLNQPLTMKELSSFMSFYEYDETEWEKYFKSEGYNEEISWDNMREFLHVLGIENYVGKEIIKNQGKVKYVDFVNVYEQMLSLLDGDRRVSYKVIKINESIPAKDSWRSGTVGSEDVLYSVCTEIGKYKKGSMYSVYLYGDKILGIRGKRTKGLPEEVVAKKKGITDDDRVKVLLKNGTSLYRKSFFLLTSGEYSQRTIKGEEKSIRSGKVVKYTKSGSTTRPKENQCIIFTPKKESARLYFVNKEGKRISKGYRGSFMVYRYSQGYIVVNDVSIREYLYGVIPSEMPSSYHMEALKAQAVCARSFAYNHIIGIGKLTQYYAQIDDTTAYQVYNKSAESERTNKAVDSTKNKVVRYNGKIATTYYYSTSCGVRQNYELWNLSKQNAGYLKAGIIHKKSKELKGSKSMKDLSSEKAFREYIGNTDKNYFEKQYRYYRWSGTFDFKANASNLNKSILKRKREASSTLKILNSKGQEVTGLSTLGKPQKMKITKRLKSGGIKELTITYEKGKVLLKNEYTIRYCLASCKVKITLQDKTQTSPDLLPSACFYISSSKKGVIKIKGGGYGHGLGMSQNGANEIAKAGFSYIKIIQFFYNGVTL